MFTPGHLGEGYLHAHYPLSFFVALKLFETKNKNFKKHHKVTNRRNSSNICYTKITNTLKYKVFSCHNHNKKTLT